MKSSPIGVESVDKCHSCIIIVLDIHLSQIIIIEVSFIQLTTFCLIFHVYGWDRKHYLKFLFPWLLLIEANQACLSGQTINHVLKKEGKKKKGSNDLVVSDTSFLRSYHVSPNMQ